MLDVELGVFGILLFCNYHVLFENTVVLLLCSVDRFIVSLVVVEKVFIICSCCECFITFLIYLIVFVISCKLDVWVLVMNYASECLERVRAMYALF